MARGFGAGGPRSLELRARGVWMGGTRLRSWGPTEFGRLHAVLELAVSDGWHAAQEMGGRGVWMGGTRLRSWGPAVLDGWDAALELGARRFWMAGTWLMS